jgi:cytochrome c oxidase subunit 3
MSAMGDVLPYRPPGAREETTAWLGMVIFLASWAMLFAALFFAYGYVRAHLTAWPPADLPLLPVGWPFANTVVLGASSALVQWGVVSARRGAVRRVGPALLGGAGLGAVFLASQAMLWHTLAARGLRTETGGPYASVFYGFTWFHALHVVVGLVGLGRVCWQAFRGAFSAARFLPVRLWAMYWHFVGVIWGLMFVTVFVV